MINPIRKVSQPLSWRNSFQERKTLKTGKLDFVSANFWVEKLSFTYFCETNQASQSAGKSPCLLRIPPVKGIIDL